MLPVLKSAPCTDSAQITVLHFTPVKRFLMHESEAFLKPQQAFKCDQAFFPSDLHVLESWSKPAPGPWAVKHSGQKAAEKAPSWATSNKRNSTQAASSEEAQRDCG